MQKLYFKDDKVIIETNKGILYPDGTSKAGKLDEKDWVVVDPKTALRIRELINTDPQFKCTLKQHVSTVLDFGCFDDTMTYEAGPDAPEAVKTLLNQIDCIYNRGFWDRVWNKVI